MKKSSILLAIFLLAGIVAVQQHATASKSEKAPISYVPSKEFLDYKNAPAITQEQKDAALKIASTSDIFKNNTKYPHGSINFVWAYPYSGTMHLSTTVNSETSQVYGQMWFDIDINSGNVLNAGFSNWRKYW